MHGVGHIARGPAVQHVASDACWSGKWTDPLHGKVKLSVSGTSFTAMNAHLVPQPFFFFSFFRS